MWHEEGVEMDTTHSTNQITFRTRFTFPNAKNQSLKIHRNTFLRYFSPSSYFPSAFADGWDIFLAGASVVL